MGPILFLSAGHTEALQQACGVLQQQGFSFTTEPSPAVTHLLLPVPSFDTDGTVKGGSDLGTLLAQLPEDVTVIGGNLTHPALAGSKTVDLLQNARYLAMNARITAHCALALAAQQLSSTLDDIPILIIGWGRIGKCLAQLLRAIGAQVTVAARKETDRAALASLGIDTVPVSRIDPSQYGLIFNTAPEMVLPHCDCNALKIDLASKPGIGGKDVVWARGLPNKAVPVSSGKLIAEAVISYLSETEAVI